MDGSQAETQSSPSPQKGGEGNHPPPSSRRQFCSQPPAPATAFRISPFVQEKTGAGGGEKAPLGRFLLQCKDEERLHELPQRWSTPCSLHDCWSREYRGRLVFVLLPSSLLHPLERICGERARAGSPLSLLSCLIHPWLSLQPGLGASDLHPSSPKTSSSTKPSPRQWRKRNPPNAALHLVCALLPVPSRRRAAARFRSRCCSSPPTSLSSVMHLFGLCFCHLKKKNATAGGGMAGHFLHHSSLECSRLDFKYNTSVLPIFTDAPVLGAPLRASPKFVLKRQKRVSPNKLSASP